MIWIPYLGIDESNHGNFPEIFVAVWSSDESGLQERGMHKRRKKQDVISFNSLDNEIKNFKHIIIPIEYKTFLGENGMFYESTRLIVVSEFINSFKGLREVVIDGSLKDKTIEEIERHTYKRGSGLKIRAEINGDRRFPLVNLADGIAYALHKHYCNTSNKHKIHSELLNHLITPRPEKYRDSLMRLTV